MQQACPVCIHSQQAAIEAAMQAGEELKAIAGAYGLRSRDVQAHKKCARYAQAGKLSPPPRYGPPVRRQT